MKVMSISPAFNLCPISPYANESNLGVSYVPNSESSCGFRDNNWCFSRDGYEANVQNTRNTQALSRSSWVSAGIVSQLPRRRPTGDFELEPKLISYVAYKYTSKSDMMYDETLWAEIIKPMLPRFKKLGALRFVVSQV